MEDTKTAKVELTAGIVEAYVGNNPLQIADIIWKELQPGTIGATAFNIACPPAKSVRKVKR